MKQVTRCVMIQNKQFYLVQIEESDFKETASQELKNKIIGCYGTIDYDWVNPNGTLIRSINFFDVAYAKTIKDAIENRKDQMYVETIKDLPEIEFMKKLSEYYKAKRGVE